ncbi:MAG: polyphosphate kinase 1 [Treponema sp.]|nr:polyphosphate kinase 1 [Treponema sp.]
MEQPLFFNRELSWIEFNARVLTEACRKEIPLLERLQFLSIVSSNFDEFFQIRVASIKRSAANPEHHTDSSGRTPPVLLKQISERCHQIIDIHHQTLVTDILPALASKGVTYIAPELYTSEQKEFIQNYFRATVFPLLTPLRITEHSMPSITSLKQYAAFLLQPIEGIKPNANPFTLEKDKPIIAIAQIPSGLPHIIWLPETDVSATKNFTLLEDLVLRYGTQLFPGFTVSETVLFRITRDADFAVDEDAGANFINAMEEVLVQRQSSFAVRLECTNTSDTIISVLMSHLKLTDDDVYKVDCLIDPKSFSELNNLDGLEKLHYAEWQHFHTPIESYWDTLKQHDLLLNVPYESYQTVTKLISDAADDPTVLAIKMTLYRTGTDSPIVAALQRAATNGKQVTCFVELKARFDEERNITWATQLEKAGVTVVYGIVNYKVHAKILLIIRRENATIKRYVHLSTGNYNPKTARLYSDLSLFTANTEIANDATQFFNLISGYSTIQTMNHLVMAPVNLKTNILTMIQREIDRSTKDNPGFIMAKMNSLADETVIEALYKASTAGVKILLNIRGICMLVPGVTNYSENIKVVSIIDRYLEHSRIFYFQNGGNAELYLSSADWMPRNLERRVELMFPITDQFIFKDIYDTLLLYFQDNTHSHTLNPDGTWTKNVPEGAIAVRAQESLYFKYKKRADTLAKQPEIEFKVRRKD